MRCFPTGVAVVTTFLNGRPKGFTANALASVSVEPPMLLICVNRASRSHSLISNAGIFCVNLLSLEQQALAMSFANNRVKDSFANIPHHRESTGAPVFDDALAFADCMVAQEHSVGTHTIFIGTVQRSGTRPGIPLGYFNGTYRDFGCVIS
jgi:flavin reductase (DIM6/NTAB) family NADH-FMN oxidoreductase RutF